MPLPRGQEISALEKQIDAGISAYLGLFSAMQREGDSYVRASAVLTRLREMRAVMVFIQTQAQEWAPAAGLETRLPMVRAVTSEGGTPGAR